MHACVPVRRCSDVHVSCHIAPYTLKRPSRTLKKDIIIINTREEIIDCTVSSPFQFPNLLIDYNTYIYMPKKYKTIYLIINVMCAKFYFEERNAFCLQLHVFSVISALTKAFHFCTIVYCKTFKHQFFPHVQYNSGRLCKL